MRHRKNFIRTFFFLFLLVCLLTGLVGMVRAPVEAAPKFAPVCGLMLAGWTFDPTPASTTAPLPSTANVTASALTGGVTGLGFQTAGANSGNAWAGSSWSQNSTPNAYFEFDVSTVGYTDILMSLWVSRSNTGPQNVSIQYSTDGSTFIQFNTYPVSTSVAQINIDLSSITDLINNSNAKFRIYGIDATGTGTLRIDDVTFTGCLVVTIDSIVPNPTNAGTTITWYSAVDGTYELRLGSTDCTDGTLIDAGSYATSSNKISFSINGTVLVEGSNTIHVCVTDASSFTHFAVGSITKDTIVPSITSFVRQSPASVTTNADTLTFRVTFSEEVMNVDGSDFVVTGTTATPTSVNPISNSVYDVTVSGGDLPNLNGTVGLDLGTTQNITDLASNPLPAGEPPVDETYNVDNSISLANIVISEFRTQGPNGANDEFIELYNPTTNWIDISGWKINSWSPTSGGTSTRATIPISTILRSGQYYLIANNHSSDGYSGSVSPNLTYGTGIADNGGIALVKADNTTVVDQVGMNTNSTYKEGTTLSPLSGNANQSYERNQNGCQDTNDNFADFQLINPSNPHNYSSIIMCDGSSGPSLITTTTTITAHTPNPTLPNGNISVSVRVTGTSLLPNSTKVNITATGLSTVCPITLNSSGTGSCIIKFTSTGTKTITATYLGDNTHKSSSNSVFHQVSSTPTPIRIPTVLPPPPPLVAINEFVPRPGHDWNHDGVVNTGDEYIELLNHGVINVNLSGYRLDDEANIGSEPYRLPSITIKPGERIVFYGSQTGLLLDDGGDGVRLIKPNGQLMDAYNYSIVNYPDQSFCRLPDNGGADDWNTNCYPTPGLQNSLSGTSLRPPTETDENQPLCPIADNLPKDFAQAECSPIGNNIWNRHYWDLNAWFDEKVLPRINSKWDVYVD